MSLNALTSGMRKPKRERDNFLIVLSEDAARDLDDVWDYLAREESVNAADTVLREIAKTYKLLGAWPLLGRKRDNLSPGARSLPVNPYVIFYRITEDVVRIVRMLHQSRDTDLVF